MEYSNPEIPEGINTSKEHPLKEFFYLTVGVFGTLFIILATLGILADRLAHYLPYSIEKDSNILVLGDSDTNKPIVAYLQKLADKISKTQDLPEGVVIKVHYSDADIVNAYATLGGNIVFFKGLLKEIPNENALVMVLAHEIAHIKHRHPIRSLGRGIIIGLVASVVSSGLGDSIISQFIGTTGSVTILKFNREHEAEADQTALDSVKAIYGHTAGADQLFVLFQQHEGKQLAPEFLRTHPTTESRLKRIRQQNNDKNAQTTPLPEQFKSWLE